MTMGESMISLLTNYTAIGQIQYHTYMYHKQLIRTEESCRMRVKSAYRPIVAHQAGGYPGFCSMKRLGVFLLSPGWDASPSQGYPPPPSIKFASTHYFIHLGGEKHRES